MPVRKYSVYRKRPTYLFAISTIKLGRFWWNLAQCFLNKSAAKSYKSFPAHLNSVSKLPSETYTMVVKLSWITLFRLSRATSVCSMSVVWRCRRRWRDVDRQRVEVYCTGRWRCWCFITLSHFACRRRVNRQRAKTLHKISITALQRTRARVKYQHRLCTVRVFKRCRPPATVCPVLW